MKEKILILASWYPSDAHPTRGIFIQDQAVVLSEVYDAAVLVPRLVGWRTLIQGKMGPKSQRVQQAGLKVYQERAIVPFPHAPQLLYRLYYRAAKRGFETLLRVWGKPALLHAHVVLPGGWAAMRLGKQYAIPVVLTEHSSPFSMHLRAGYQQRLVQETLSHIDHLLPVSPVMAQQIDAFQDGIPSTIIGNLIKSRSFVPVEGVRTEWPASTMRFLTVARLSEQKGLRYLFKAAQLVIQRGFTSFELIIGGDGPERAQLEQMAQSLGLSSRCKFLGHLMPQEVRYWMQRCDVFVLPSLHETFGIVLGEAMACGKPVIATRCGGPEFVVTPDVGILVDIANPMALAEAMEAFMSGRFTYDPRTIRQRVVERFGEEALLRNISKVYEQVWSKPEAKPRINDPFLFTEDSKLR
jgi:glycosyltransferase involved in cell wall biosynthesis